MWGYRPLNMGCTRDGFGFGKRLLMGLFCLLSLLFLSALATILMMRAGAERAAYTLRLLGN